MTWTPEQLSALPKCIICGSTPEVHNECGVQIRIQCSNRACLSEDCIAKDFDEAAAMWTNSNTPIQQVS